jgi:hypothetical protein
LNPDPRNRQFWRLTRYAFWTVRELHHRWRQARFED